MEAWYYGRSTSVAGGQCSNPTRGWNDPPDLSASQFSTDNNGPHNGSSNSINSATSENSPAVNPFRRQTPGAKPKVGANLSASSFSIFDPTKAVMNAMTPPPTMSSNNGYPLITNNAPTSNGLGGMKNGNNFFTPPPPSQTNGSTNPTSYYSPNTVITSPQQYGVMSSTYGVTSQPPNHYVTPPPPSQNSSNGNFHSQNGLAPGGYSMPPPPPSNGLLTPKGYLSNGYSHENSPLHQSVSQPCFSSFNRGQNGLLTPTSNGDGISQNQHQPGGFVGSMNSSANGVETSIDSHMANETPNITGAQNKQNNVQNGVVSESRNDSNSNAGDCLNVLNYIIGNMRPKMNPSDFERLWASVQNVLANWESLSQETKYNSSEFINALGNTNIGYARNCLEKVKTCGNANLSGLFEYLLSVYESSNSTSAISSNSSETQSLRSGFESQPVPMFSL